VRVGIVSSAYGREATTSFVEPGYRVQKMPVSETGDEVMILAHDLPSAVFSVDVVKLHAARRLVESGEVDIIIVDDGFQHWPLHADVHLLTYDAGVKKRTLRLFPNGILREPLSAIRRAHIVVITRANFAKDIQRLRNKLEKIHPDADYYHANFYATQITKGDQQLAVKYLEDQSVFLFAGVGNFRALRKQVTALAGDIEGYIELADHQRYNRELLERIKIEVTWQDPDIIVTTAKDFVKIGDFDFGRELCYLDLAIDLDPGEEKLVHDLMTRFNLGDET
jgi:tetraacyldisaccharide 4'-kinase